MKPDELVPSLDVCRRMVAAGWKAETCFAWYYIGGPDEYEVATASDMAECKRRMDEQHAVDHNFPTIEYRVECPAPTSDEIAEAIGDGVLRWGTVSVFAAQGNVATKLAARPVEALAALWLALREEAP